MTLQNATNRNQTSVRQTVSSGSVDASGFPNALSIGSGLAVTLTASTIPFELTFAAGSNNGAIDYPGRFTSNQSFSGLTASTTCYLYVDRNGSTGALTTGFSTLTPAYSTIAPASPSTDQHWFDLSTFTLKRWSGSAWVVFQRVFVGECVTGASTVSSVATYAYRGFYRSLWLAVTSNTTYNFNHNLGMPSNNIIFNLYTSIAGNDTDAMPAPAGIGTQNVMPPSTFYSYQWQNLSSGNRKTVALVTYQYVALSTSNVWQTAGFYQITGLRSW